MYNSNPCQRYLAIAKYILKYLKGIINLDIIYKRQNISKSSREFWSNEIRFFDANWRRDLDSRRSIISFIILLNDAVIIWKNCKQFIIALSIIEAEYMALTNIVKEIKWIRQLFDELNYDIVSHPLTILRTDNQGVLILAKNPVNHSRSKHIDIKHHFIRETIAKGIVWLEYIASEDITADFLTKPLGRVQLQRCLSFIGMRA